MPNYGHHKSALGGEMLAPWPVRRSPNWIGSVARDLSAAEQTPILWSVRRGVTLGEAVWVETVARKFDLESALCVPAAAPGRPRSDKRRPMPRNGTGHLCLIFFNKNGTGHLCFNKNGTGHLCFTRTPLLHL